MVSRRLLVAVLGLCVALAAVGAGLFFFTRDAASTGAHRTPYTGGVPYVTAYAASLKIGDDRAGVSIYDDGKQDSDATFEAALSSRDGRYLWVVDHPVGKVSRTRVRKFDRSGRLVGAFDAPVGTTVFTPGAGDDLWAARSETQSRGEYLVHYDGAGKLMGQYPLPPYAYTSAISIDSSGAAWILNDEWATDPDSMVSTWVGALLPIADARGQAVVDVSKLAVANGAFIGMDGRLYSMEASQSATSDDTWPTWHVVVRDSKGYIDDYRLPPRTRPFMADAQGRVYAQVQPRRSQLPVGVSSLGDAAAETVPVVVFKDGKEISRTYVQDMGARSQAYPPISLQRNGAFSSPVWDQGFLRVAVSSPTTRPSSRSDSDTADASPDARVVFAGEMPLSGDPYLARDAFERDLWQTVYSGLVTHDASLTPVPDLATAVPTPGDGISADGKTIEWKIDTARTWHDGSKVTPEDVVATWRHLKEPSTIARTEPFPGFRYITDVRASGDSVVVTLSKPFGAAPEAFFPYVLPRRIVESSKSQLNGSLLSSPVGSGPYALKQWDASGRWLLVAAPGAKTQPKIQKLAVDFVPVDRAIKRQSSSEVPSVWLWVPAEDQAVIKRQGGADDLVMSATGRWWGLLFNSRQAPMDSKSMRDRWLSIYPLRESLKANGVKDDATLEVGPFYGAELPLDASAAKGADGVKAFRDYYTSRGWRDSNKDAWIDKGGRTIRFKFSQSFRWRLHEVPPAVPDAAIANMNKVGFIEDNTYGEHYFYNSVTRLGALSRGVPMVGAGVFPGFVDPAWGSVFDPADTPTWKNPYGRSVTFAQDAQLRRLHEQARASYDPVTRREIGRKIAERVQELTLAFYERPEMRAASVRGIKGYEPAKYPAGDFWNVEEWTTGETR